jgi:hypothetical protein
MAPFLGLPGSMASSATPTDAAFRPFAKQLYKRLNPPFLRPTPIKLRTTNDPDVYHNQLLLHCMDRIFNVTATVPATSPFGGMRERAGGKRCIETACSLC